jgi:hypothetical protein
LDVLVHRQVPGETDQQIEYPGKEVTQEAEQQGRDEPERSPGQRDNQVCDGIVVDVLFFRAGLFASGGQTAGF